MHTVMIGSGPLPKETNGICGATGLRTQQFLDGLLAKESGEEITLVTIEDEFYSGIKEKENLRQVSHKSVSKGDGHIKTHLKNILKKKAPDIVIAVNTFPSFLTAQVIPAAIPFWADLNGWIIGEAQVQNAFLPRAWKRERTILKRADKISTVSHAQCGAVFGELAALGRLNKDNLRHHFVDVIENSCRPLSTMEEMKKRSPHFFRGNIFPKDSFALLWLGGFNAWADEETLFVALEMAMTKEKNLHFIATGGILPGIDEKQYPRFQRRITDSLFADRFHLLGWIDTNKVPKLLHECDAGINVDIRCPETLFGARNRLNEMMRFGLPIISTEGSEIVAKLAKVGAGLSAKSGDSFDIAEKIHTLVRERKRHASMKEKQRELMSGDFSVMVTTTSLRIWKRNPQKAPVGSISMTPSFLREGVHFLLQRGFRILFQKVWQKISSRLGFAPSSS